MSYEIEGASANPKFEYFDQRQIDLQKELCHPHWEDLRKLLANHDDLTVQLAEIAAYCEVILDGYYDQHDLCRVLCNKLKEMRMGSTIIVIDGFSY